MTVDDTINSMDRWIKKYLFISLVSGIYFWLSFLILDSLLLPEVLVDEMDWRCGTGVFTITVLHFLLAGLTSMILTFHFIRKKNYPFWLKITLLSCVLFLPLISLLLS